MGRVVRLPPDPFFVLETVVPYRLVIFDFDGTLADSFPWFIATINEVAAAHRFRRIEAADVDLLRRMGARQIVKHLGVAWWRMPLIARDLRRRKARDIASIGLFPGIGAMLRALSEKGVALAVVSSNAEANIRNILGPENAALIAHYECSVSMFGKPARFRKVLKRSGVAPREALCIGDEIRDWEAAHAAGIPFGAVLWGYTVPEAMTALRPAEVFGRVEEIVERVG